MKTLKDNIRFSIKIKIFVLIISIILFISTSLVLFFIIRTKEDLEKEVEKRGILEIKSFVLDVEYAVFTKNLIRLENILKSKLQKPDIVYLEIEGNNERILAKQKRDEYGIFFKADEATLDLGENVVRSILSSSSKANARIYEFITPILTEKLAENEFENELDLIMMGGTGRSKQYLPSKIGTAKIAISLEKMDRRIANLIFGSVFIVLVVVVISILISIFFTYRITAPIRNVALAAIEISEGNLEKRAVVNTSDETSILAMNFNKMAVSLKYTVNNLKKEIAERVQATNNLQKSEEKYRKLIESANDAIFVADVETGSIIAINKMAEKLLGKSKNEIIGMHQTRLHPKEEIEHYKKLFLEHVQKGAGFAGIPDELYVCRKDGSRVPVEISSSVIDIGDKKIIQGIFRDISERKLMEAELRSAKDQLQEIIDNTTAIIYLKDIKGRYLLVNKRYEKLFHISKQMIIGKTDYDLFPNAMADEFRKNDKNVINANSPQEIEEIVLHDDGLHTYISIKFPVYNSSKELYAVCGISTDITERKQIEGEILEIEEKERNRIGRDLHDDLGQLLTVISLKAQVLKKALDKKALEEESKQAREITELTNDAINHIQLLAKGLSPLHENENNLFLLLEELAYNVKKIHGISCSFDCDKEIFTCEFSVLTNLYRIVQEAINNAIKHANANNIAIKIFSDNGEVIFQIKDDGKGITNMTQQSKGLGLRSMKYRANLIGASLDFRNDTSGGTIVNCTFKRKVIEG